jgi:hypothetical protein
MAAESQISKQKTEDRRRKTEDRIGRPGNQSNRVQVTRRTGNEEKLSRCPDESKKRCGI